ncbi:IS630 family transposase [Rhizobium ruizarguesonis]|nr:IS630 family transposase [Rhizobium ruizarguesonis]TBF43746.1 IS630 family transposase [Rhizobium leguminosarum]TBF86385.1 IS630 family transposase [Rhizobium leguminosarum]TBG08390.1 IS630 family transposase [Rhizobium leguminosarum]TBG28534.1 IS630 family transposase [Rhizobium leguminosarum]
MAAIRNSLPKNTEIELWWADEARISQKNKITRRWARRGTRPSAPLDQRTMWAYIFGAICPKRGKGAGLVLPYCDTDAMNQHLLEISQAVDDGAHAVLILDQAGWHVTPKLSVPDNITLLFLPPRSPELNLDGLADAIEMMRQSARLTSTYGNRVALSAGAGVFRMGEAAI